MGFSHRFKTPRNSGRRLENGAEISFLNSWDVQFNKNDTDGQYSLEVRSCLLSLKGGRRRKAEEEELLRHCVTGDEQAREELCRAYWPVALRMARYITGEAGEAEDLAQESFYRLLSHLPRFRGEASVTTWLYRTIINLYRDRLRQLTRRREYSLDSLPPRMTPFVLTTPDPAEVVEGRFWRRPFVKAVKKLSRRDRLVLWLHFRREYSHAQIAKRLNCTEDAVKCRLYRLTRYLRQELAF